MEKSIINSEQVKKAVHSVVEEALEKCAEQQEAHGKPYVGLIDPSNEMKAFYKTKPTQVKISIEFYFGEETHTDKRGKLVCIPVVDLTNIK